jgi:hypothetical protein
VFASNLFLSSKLMISYLILLQVSMFESGCEEFIFPEALYTWRLQSIENGAGRTRHQNELPVVAYFSAEDASRLRSRREDQDMESFPGTVKRYLPNAAREPDDHLLGSGYGTLKVEWDSEDPPSLLSPWEVTLRDKVYETPPPPTLSEAATVAVGKALAKVEALPNVEEYFLYPVDESRYSDYRNRVEVPMNFSFIKERLAAGYYSNVRSVLSDARLIKENCMKYNGPSELSQTASDIYDSFKDEVKRHVDIDEAPVSGPVSLLAGDAAGVRQEEISNGPSRAPRLARRQRQDAGARASRLRSGSEDGVSSLERLPFPEQRSSTSRTTRRRSVSAIQNTEPSQRLSRRGQQVDSAASGRATRSASNRSLLAVDRDAPNDSESEVEYDDGGTFAADRDNDEEDIHDSDDSSDDPTVRRVSRRTSGRTSTRQRATGRSRRAKSGSTNTADVSSSDEWEEGRLSEEDEEEEESEASSPPPARRSRRSSRQEGRRTSPRRSTRAAAHASPESTRRSTRAHQDHSMADLSTSYESEPESENEEEEPEASSPPPARRSRRSSLQEERRTSPRRSTRAAAHASPESTRRSTRAHQDQSIADLDTSYKSEPESENEESEEEPKMKANRRGALKRRSRESPCSLVIRVLLSSRLI